MVDGSGSGAGSGSVPLTNGSGSASLIHVFIYVRFQPLSHMDSLAHRFSGTPLCWYWHNYWHHQFNIPLPVRTATRHVWKCSLFVSNLSTMLLWKYKVCRILVVCTENNFHMLFFGLPAIGPDSQLFVRSGLISPVLFVLISHCRSTRASQSFI